MNRVTKSLVAKNLWPVVSRGSPPCWEQSHLCYQLFSLLLRQLAHECAKGVGVPPYGSIGLGWGGDYGRDVHLEGCLYSVPELGHLFGLRDLSAICLVGENFASGDTRPQSTLDGVDVLEGGC